MSFPFEFDEIHIQFKTHPRWAGDNDKFYVVFSLDDAIKLLEAMKKENGQKNKRFLEAVYDNDNS